MVKERLAQEGKKDPFRQAGSPEIRPQDPQDNCRRSKKRCTRRTKSRVWAKGGLSKGHRDMVVREVPKQRCRRWVPPETRRHKPCALDRRANEEKEQIELRGDFTFINDSVQSARLK